MPRRPAAACRVELAVGLQEADPLQSEAARRLPGAAGTAARPPGVAGAAVHRRAAAGMVAGTQEAPGAGTGSGAVPDGHIDPAVGDGGDPVGASGPTPAGTHTGTRIRTQTTIPSGIPG